MSSSDNVNFESLYNQLKEEYDQSKKDNDEICKEYESTIQLLSDSVESFKKEKKDLQIKLSKIENDQKAFKKEKENLIKKNKDKMIDIQCLNEQNEKLNELIKKLKEEKTLFDTKIVTMENDIDHYQNKIREYEDFIDELKSQLEDALEENITLQTEFETYKLNTGDQLIRKDEELRDIRNDITNKEKIIQRLSKKPSERFNIQKVQKNFIKDRKFLRYQRRYTIGEKEEVQYKRNENENKVNKDDTTNNKQLNVIMEDTNYKKALVTYKTSQKNIDIGNSYYNSSFNSNNNSNNNISEKKKNKILQFNHNSEKEKKEENKINQNGNMNGLNSIIKKQFGELVICEENKIYVNPLVHKLLSKEQLKEFTISLQNMLIRIKQRKNNLYNQKIDIKEKLEKLCFRVK